MQRTVVSRWVAIRQLEQRSGPDAATGRHRGDRGLQERERGARAVPGEQRILWNDRGMDEALGGKNEAPVEVERLRAQSGAVRRRSSAVRHPLLPRAGA